MCTRTCNGNDDVTNEHVYIYWYTTTHVETSRKGNKRKRKVIFMGQLFSYAQPATERACRGFHVHRETEIDCRAQGEQDFCQLWLDSVQTFLKYENVGMTMILDCEKKKNFNEQNCIYFS